MSAWVRSPEEARELSRQQWDLLVRLFGDDAWRAAERMREIDEKKSPVSPAEEGKRTSSGELSKQ